MSRSTPERHLVHPCHLWLEWNGELGHLRYYDRDAKQDVTVNLPFTFLLLDRLATVRGWHTETDSAIYANEVEDVTRDRLVVKSHKGGIIAEGTYRQIRDAIRSQGAHFAANLYIAIKGEDGQLSIASLLLKGAALMAWSEFEGKHRARVYHDAVCLTGSATGQKGRIIYHTPVCELRRVSDETAQQAYALDQVLRAYLVARRKQIAEHEAIRDEPAPAVEPVTADRSSNVVPMRQDESPTWILEAPAPEEGAPLGSPVLDVTADDIPF